MRNGPTEFASHGNRQIRARHQEAQEPRKGQGKHNVSIKSAFRRSRLP